MVASRQLDIPFYRGIVRQQGRKFGALAQVTGQTAFPFLCKYIVPAAKRLGADFLKLADVFGDRQKFKTIAKIVGRQILREQLGHGSNKKTASRVIPTKSAKETSWSRRDIFTNISH